VPEPSRRDLTTADAARLAGGRLLGDGSIVIAGLNTVEAGAAGELTFVGSPAHARQWSSSKASAALVTEGLLPEDPDRAGRALIFVADADRAMIALLEHLAPPAELPGLGIDSSASVSPDAQLGSGVRIGPGARVGARCRLDDGVVLHAGAVLYPDVTVGANSILHANCVVRERCSLGRRVILHPGAVIGADGFGYRPDASGRGLRKVPQIGTVEIHDDVEIGACACIDRAKFGATVIGEGSKIDNLVQIGHNCRIGRGCVIAGCVGLAGSVEVGDGVQLGGGAGIADHLRIGHGARVAAMSAVRTDVPDGVTVLGVPAEPATLALRQLAALRKLPDLLRRLGAEAGVGRRGSGAGSP
jgi:UDP-3-O-[3-hydroxymyristoyl] glucosamine N-acyltransferase